VYVKVPPVITGVPELTFFDFFVKYRLFQNMSYFLFKKVLIP